MAKPPSRVRGWARTGCFVILGMVLACGAINALTRTRTPGTGTAAPTRTPQAAAATATIIAEPTEAAAPPTVAPAQPTEAPAAAPTEAPAAAPTEAPVAGPGGKPTVEPGAEAYPCAEGQLKGNRESKIYHAPGQQSYARTQADVRCFDTPAEAEAAGYRAAKR